MITWFSIIDQGIGINPEYLDHIFERFYRVRNPASRQYSGIGLGLYVTKAIIERHGGRIWVANNQGVGCTFSFTLPRTRQDILSNLHKACNKSVGFEPKWSRKYVRPKGVKWILAQLVAGIVYCVEYGPLPKRITHIAQSIHKINGATQQNPSGNDENLNQWGTW